jgi:hypothetical protein
LPATSREVGDDNAFKPSEDSVHIKKTSRNQKPRACLFPFIEMENALAKHSVDFGNGHRSVALQRVGIWESQMTALARAFSHLFSASSEFDVLKTLALFCGVGLLAALLMLTYGIDLSPGFF